MGKNSERKCCNGQLAPVLTCQTKKGETGSLQLLRAYLVEKEGSRELRCLNGCWDPADYAEETFGLNASLSFDFLPQPKS